MQYWNDRTFVISTSTVTCNAQGNILLNQITAVGLLQTFGTTGQINELRLQQAAGLYSSMYVDGTSVFYSNNGTGSMFFQNLGNGNIFFDNNTSAPIVSMLNSGALQFNFYTTAGVLKNDASGNVTLNRG